MLIVFDALITYTIIADLNMTLEARSMTLPFAFKNIDSIDEVVVEHSIFLHSALQGTLQV